MQNKLRELLRGSRIKVSCVAEVDTVERALDSVEGCWDSRDAWYWSVPEEAGYLVVNSHLEMYFKNKLPAYDVNTHKEVTVEEIKKLMGSTEQVSEKGEIKKLMGSTEQVSEKEYKTEISLGGGVVLRTNGKVTYEDSGVIIVE